MGFYPGPLNSANMTEAGQTGLDAFSPETETRPDEEAAHVAGNGGATLDEVIDVQRETLPDADGDLELAVMQVDYTVSGYGDDEYPVVHVFGRTPGPDHTLEHVKVLGFRPYFYVPQQKPSMRTHSSATTGSLAGKKPTKTVRPTRVSVANA